MISYAKNYQRMTTEWQEVVLELRTLYQDIHDKQGRLTQIKKNRVDPRAEQCARIIDEINRTFYDLTPYGTNPSTSEQEEVNP